jgi:hypothetical protein
VLPGSPFQKIIPINTENCVYMLAYADNANAIALALFNKSDLQSELDRCCLKILNIDENYRILKYRKVFWKIGTHATGPNAMRSGTPNIRNIQFIGEAVSNDQGWVTGALRSVHEL